MKLQLKTPRPETSSDSYRAYKLSALDRMVNQQSPFKKPNGNQIDPTSPVKENFSTPSKYENLFTYKKNQKDQLAKKPIKIGFSKAFLKMDDTLVDDVIRLLEDEKQKIKESDEYGELLSNGEMSFNVIETDRGNTDRSDRSYVTKRTKINQLDREKQKLEIRSMIKKGKARDVFVSREVDVGEDEYGFQIQRKAANLDIVFEDVRRLEAMESSEEAIEEEDFEEARFIEFED